MMGAQAIDDSVLGPLLVDHPEADQADVAGRGSQSEPPLHEELEGRLGAIEDEATASKVVRLSEQCRHRGLVALDVD